MRLARRTLLAASLTAALAPAGRAGAGALVPYTAAAFAEAQAAGRTILVHVHADWCPTCRAQAPILAELLAREPRLAGAVALQVDFDNDKDFLKAHRVPSQSTLLVFKGRTETARSVGETDPARLAAAILGGLTA
jgi:thiol:disulfide interchange protein